MTYRDAANALPWQPGQPTPEEAVRRGRIDITELLSPEPLWIECTACGGEGTFEAGVAADLDTELCDVCGGDGGWYAENKS